MNLAPLESKLWLNHLRWSGHVERSDKQIKKCTHVEIDTNNAHDQPMWKKALRTAMKSLARGNHGPVAQNG